MPFLQTKIFVDDFIYNQVKNGTLALTGAVVRKLDGKILKHLPIAIINGVFKSTPKVLLATTAISLIGGGVALLLAHREKAKAKELLIQNETITTFNNSLIQYLDATKDGSVTSTEIDNLLLSLENLNKKKIDGTIIINLDKSQINSLVNSIYLYTYNLNKASDKILAFNSPTQDPKNSINEIYSYLEVQKQLLKKVS